MVNISGRSMGARIAAVLSGLMLASTFIVGAAITKGGSALLIETSKRELVHSADMVALRLGTVLEGAENDAKFIARTSSLRSLLAEGADVGPGLDSARADLRDVARALIADHPWYTGLRVVELGRAGRTLLAVGRDSDAGRPMSDGSAAGVGLSPSPAGEAWAGVQFLILPAGGGTGPRMLRVLLPVASGAFPAAVVIDMELEPIFTSAAGLLDPGASLYIASVGGRLLYGPDDGRAGKAGTAGPDTLVEIFPQSAAVLSGRQAKAFGQSPETDARGALVGFFKSMPVGEAGGMQRWVIGLAMPQDLILADVAEVRRRSAVLTLLFALVGVGVAVGLAMLMTRPIRQMARAVDQAGRGRTDVHLPIGRSDEIGQLARAFQSLLDRTNRYRWELERRKKIVLGDSGSSEAAAVLVEVAGRIDGVGRTAGLVLGYTANELIGQPVGTILPGLDLSALVRQLDRSGDTGGARETEGRRKDGSRLRLWLSADPLISGPSSGARLILLLQPVPAPMSGLMPSADSPEVPDSAGRTW
jgi:PAS domain S-box-containing protein